MKARWRARDIPAKALQLATVAAIDALTSVEVNASNFSEGVVFFLNFAHTCAGESSKRSGGLAGAVTGGGYSARRSGIAGGKAGLIGPELGRLVVLHCRIE